MAEPGADRRRPGVLLAEIEHRLHGVVEARRLVGEALRKQQIGAVGDADADVAGGVHLPRVPLQAVAEVDRDRDAAGPVLQAVLAEGEQVGDPRHQHRHPMHVNADHPLEALPEPLGRVEPAFLGVPEEMADGMEEKGAGAARGIEDALR